MIGGQTPGHRILLVHVSLDVHVGVSQGKFLLDSDQVDVNILVAEGLLELDIGYIGCSLDELQNCLLNVVQVALLGGNLEFGPRDLTRDIRDIATINLARVLALQSSMT